MDLTALFCLIIVGGKLVWPILIVEYLSWFNIILDEVCIVIPNTLSMYIRVLCGASLDKN